MILTGCSHLGITTQPRETPKLEVTLPAPLELENITWKVFSYNDITYFGLDSKNYEALSRNTEQIQNRLDYLQSVVEQQKYFYETNP